MASPEPLTVRSGRIRKARRLATRRFRDSEGEFLAEGPQAVREAIAGGHAAEVFATAAARDRWRDAHEPWGDAPWTIVDDEVLATLADTVHPQGLIARCRQFDLPVADVVADAHLVAVCLDVRDPGNIGTVVRCADAAGADAVIVAGDSVDPYNPKAVRASAGSVFHVPFARERDLDTVMAEVRGAGLRLIGADAAAKIDLYSPRAALTGPTAWVFGNEAHGLGPLVTDRLDGTVAIPIHGRAESLNLATAAAVCLYESARIRDRH